MCTKLHLSDTVELTTNLIWNKGSSMISCDLFSYLPIYTPYDLYICIALKWHIHITTHNYNRTMIKANAAQFEIYGRRMGKYGQTRRVEEKIDLNTYNSAE